MIHRADQIVRLTTEFGVPVINVLWTVVAGKRFQQEDPQVQRMMSLLNRLQRVGLVRAEISVLRLFREKFVIEYMFPVWGMICYLVPGLNTRRKIIKELRSMFRETIKDHQQTMDINAPRQHSHFRFQV